MKNEVKADARGYLNLSKWVEPKTRYEVLLKKATGEIILKPIGARPVSKRVDCIHRSILGPHCHFCGMMPWEHDMYGLPTPQSKVGLWKPTPWSEDEITDWLAQGIIDERRAKHLRNVKVNA